MENHFETAGSFSVTALKEQLNTQHIGRDVRYFDELDSTNEEAKRCYDCSEGTLFIANSQTTGRGRLGRDWLSEAGCGIYMSLVLTPDTEPEKIPQITLIAGIALCRALGGNSRIKWPNDIVIGSKKVCGILTEAVFTSDGLKHVICGIGINVNTKNFPDALSDKATSLMLETGIEQIREKIIADVMNEFEPLYTQFINNGFSSVLDEYRSLCITVNSEVHAVYQNKTITGTAVNVDSCGGLVIKTADNTVTVDAGEVSVRGMLGYV